MPEIYNYPIGAHDTFAAGQKNIDEFVYTYKGAVAPRPIVDTVAKPTHLGTLLQTNQKAPWAFFDIPLSFKNQSVSLYVAPSLGSEEKIDADIKRIEGYTSLGRNFNDQAEANILMSAIKEVKDTNHLIDEVKARCGQFAKG